MRLILILLKYLFSKFVVLLFFVTHIVQTIEIIDYIFIFLLTQFYGSEVLLDFHATRIRRKSKLLKTHNVVVLHFFGFRSNIRQSI